MTAYYNECDAIAVEVLRECSTTGVIAPGVVDGRSIKDVDAAELRRYTQCHFFAGAGLWSVAARLAGWPDDEPLWTGSCPCQPFSQAGKGLGVDDPRHLWPDFFRLIRANRPPVVVGEQVSGAAGYGWLDGVRADLEGEGYACWAVDIPACAVDAPHIRNRLYWVAVADAYGRGRGGRPEDAQRGSERRAVAERPDDVEYGAGERRGEGRPEPEFRSGRSAVAGADVLGVTQGDAELARLERHARDEHGARGRSLAVGSVAASDGGSRFNGLGYTDGSRADFDAARCGPRSATRESNGGTFWTESQWIVCHDGKARRIPRGSEPDIRDVADGISAESSERDPSRLLVPAFKGRTQAWKIAGNAIVPQLAVEVLRALMEVLDA